MEEALIRVKDLCKIYNPGENEVRALDHINLEINKGEFVIISGKSGSGKSTLCNIIGLLDKPDKGKIFIEDEEINYKSKQISNLLSKKISYLFQNFALIDNATIGYNLELVYPSKRHRKSKKKLIEEKPMDVKPKLIIKNSTKNFYDFKVEDFEIDGYDYNHDVNIGKIPVAI